MAHELELVNGQHSFFEVGKVRTAWHELGNLLPVAPRSIEELFETAPFLNYPVVKLPTTVTMPDGTILDSTKAFTTWRTDRNIELGAVGADYTPVQNREAFTAVVGPLVDQGVLAIETGGVLRDGADAWLLGRFDIAKFGPVVREVFADEVIPYVLVAVNHAGRRGNLIQLTPIRVVCANTLGASEGVANVAEGETSTKAAIVRHTGDAEAKMVEAAQSMFGGIIERYEVIARQYKTLKATYLDEALFRSLVLVPTIGVHPTRRHNWNPEAKLAEKVVERYEARRESITWLWTNGKGHAGDGSAWEAYNGVVEAIDHNPELFPSKSGVYRLGALLDGQLREKKQAALTQLVDYATDDTGSRDRAVRGRAMLVTAK